MKMKLISQWKQLFLLIMCSVIFWLKFSTEKPKEKINWLFFYDQEPIYKQNFNFTLIQHLKCEGDNHFLVILVATRANEAEARRAIRVTWGQKRTWLGKSVSTLFLIGRDAEHEKQVQEEFAQYGDIISQNFIESYNNLTLKTIMAFQWISEFCPNAEYVMKIDSDVFLNTKNLVSYLLKVNKSVSSDFFTGYPLINTKPYRGLAKKAYISKADYPFSIYPPYCSGFGYVFSGELGLKVFKLMGHIKPIRFEDVFVGICLKILDVNLHISEKELFFINLMKFDKGLFSRLIAVHGFTPQQLRSYWKELQGLRTPDEQGVENVKA